MPNAPQHLTAGPVAAPVPAAAAGVVTPVLRLAGLQALARRVFSFPAVLIAGLVFVTVVTASGRFNDPDLWWQLKIGQIIATTHSIPTSDAFSFTAQGQPWTAHEWLAQLTMYGAYAAGGPRGLMAWLCVLGSLIFVLVYALCRTITGDDLTSFFGAFVAWLFATVGLAIRPLILGHLFFVLELLLLELGRTKSRRWLWCLPPLFALWANCHASYSFGLAVMAIYAVCSRLNGQWGLVVSSDAWDRKGRNTLLMMLLLSVGALCCNPVGIRLLVYPLNTVFRLFQQSSSVSAVDEWLPPDLRDPRTIAMLATVVGVFLLAAVRRSELHLREVLLLLAAFGLAIQHVRMLFLFGIAASPVIARLLAAPRASGRREHPVLNAALLAAALAAIVGAFPGASSLQDQVRATSPVAAVDYIRRHALSGPMLNEYQFGGYLIWALPEHKVFIDGRADVYDWAGIFAEYGRWATLAVDPNLLLDKYRIRLCLLRKRAPLGRVLACLPQWRKAYSDDVAEVFVR